MTTLAIHGGKPCVVGPIRQFNTIGRHEIEIAKNVLETIPLSGFLGGQRRGGPHVNTLEDEWAETFGVKHAIAMNSATSGLLAAAFAVGLGRGDKFLCPALTMSATAAAPMFTGATPVFGDVEDETFGINPYRDEHAYVDAAFVTNLFGHPVKHLRELRAWADKEGLPVIEDNSQAPFAMEDGRYTGTIGHIGVFSLNVHKHIQCGEGGICVTNDDDLADRMRMTRNHGELAGGPIGLNLRMTEVTAAIALSQLARAKEIIAGRVALAESLTDAVDELPGITPPVVRAGCTHSYYCWAAKIADNRDFIVEALRAEGVPIRAGYVDPLYRLPAFNRFARPCSVAERLHDRELALVEICAIDPTPEQVKQIGDAFEKVMTWKHT